MYKLWGMRLLLAGALLACHGALAQVNPIQFASEIFHVTRSGVLMPATSAAMGSVVEYRVYATNSGDTTLPAGRVQIFGPVTEDMQLVPGSATPTSRRVLTEFTVDDASYYSYADLSPREVKTVRLVRWTLLEPMEPGAVEVFVYRVVVGEDYPVLEWALVNLEFDRAKLHAAGGPGAGSGGGAVSTGGTSATSQGFQLVSYSARWEGNYLVVVGEVRNVGSVAAGVELQIVARDAGGRLVDVATFWPASVDNIRPGMNYGFRRTVTSERSAVRVDVQIVGVRVW